MAGLASRSVYLLFLLFVLSSTLTLPLQLLDDASGGHSIGRYVLGRTRKVHVGAVVAREVLATIKEFGETACRTLRVLSLFFSIFSGSPQSSHSRSREYAASPFLLDLPLLILLLLPASSTATPSPSAPRSYSSPPSSPPRTSAPVNPTKLSVPVVLPESPAHPSLSRSSVKSVFPSSCYPRITSIRRTAAGARVCRPSPARLTKHLRRLSIAVHRCVFRFLSRSRSASRQGGSVSMHRKG